MARRSGGFKYANLHFPMGGMDRRFGYQNQPPYTTPYAINVRPAQSTTQRERGASRPGTGRAFRETLGSGNPVRLLATLDVVQQNGYTFWQDTFEGSSLGSVWATSAWLTAAPTVTNRTARASYSQAATGITRSAFSPTIATGADYVVEMYIVPSNGRHHGTYSIFCRMNDATPNVSTGGVKASLVMTGTTGAFSGSLTVDGATTYNFTSGSDGFAAAGWFTVRISGNNISAYWRGNTLISGQAVAAAAGQRVGMGMDATVSGGTCIVDRFRVQYYRNGQTQNVDRRILLASSNGTLYRETEFGSLTSIGGNPTLASDVGLMAAQRTQKLYIADYSDWLATGTDGVRGTANNKFDSATYSDWTTRGIDTDDHVLVIYNATGNMTNGTYTISSVASGELTLGSNCATAAGGGCSFFITRGAKVYTHSTNTLALWTATTDAGSVPAGCPIIVSYRDRLVLAGGADGPHIIYMSRQGYPNDWDYSSEAAGVGRAWYGSVGDAGIPGNAITALIPHADQCMLISNLSELYILRGDPTYGGQIDNISRRVGIVDKRAWCYVPSNEGGEGMVLFLSLDGLYMVPAGCQTSAPVPVSRDKLPDELLFIDKTAYEVTMAYDQLDRGVHIFMSSRTSGNTTHWWFDWKTKGFFQMTLPVAQDPFTVLEYTSSCGEDSCVLMGGRDGVVRRFHKYNDKDDGNNAISSAVDYGPIMMGDMNGWTSGVLSELVGELGEDSSPVNWSARSGNTPEAAYNASALADGTWSETGLQYTNNPRCGGAAAFVRLSNGASRPWSIERMAVRIEPKGRNTR